MARIGFGASVGVDRDNGTIVFGGITDISVGGLTLATVDATDYDSPGRYRQFIAGLRDGGEIALMLQSEPVGYEEFEVQIVGGDSGIAFLSSNSYGQPSTANPLPVVMFTTGALPDFLDGSAADVVYLVDGDAELGAGGYFVHTGSPATGMNLITVTATGSGKHYMAPVSQHWAEAYWRLLRGDTLPFYIGFPNGTRFEADCICTNISLAAPMADKIATSVTLKISGQPVWID